MIQKKNEVTPTIIEKAISTNLEKKIVSFPCGKTYDFINETHIHAHPVTSSYPSEVYPYLMARAKGGITDYLYKVVKCIEFDPMNKSAVDSLPTIYDSLKLYIEKRIYSFKFNKSPIPYRFYMLEPIHKFIPPFTISNNNERPKYYSLEEVGITNLECRTQYINLAKIENNAKSFVDYVHSQDHNTKPIDFTTATGILAKDEGYKTRIAREVNEMLKTSEWDESWIGTGEIAKRICKAMDMSGNLVFSSNKMNFKDHFDVERPEYDSNAERAIYNIYRGKNDKEAFEYATKVFGRKYATLAYLYFTKDDTRFLPTSPDNFDKSFKRLQIDFSMSGKCSWDNYCQFIEIITEVGNVMPRYMDLAHNVRLIDAHSFVWILSGKEFINWEISSDNAKAQEVAAMKKQLVAFINDYVQHNGTDEIKSSSEILKIAGLSDKDEVILPSDYCYNRYNNGRKSFEGPFLFEYVGFNRYKILGENYPYSGSITHTSGGRTGRTIGTWDNGYVDIIDEDIDWKEYKRNQEEIENKQIDEEYKELEEEINDPNLRGTDRLLALDISFLAAVEEMPYSCIKIRHSLPDSIGPCFFIVFSILLKITVTCHTTLFIIEIYHGGVHLKRHRKIKALRTCECHRHFLINLIRPLFLEYGDLNSSQKTNVVTATKIYINLCSEINRMSFFSLCFCKKNQPN